MTVTCTLAPGNSYEYLTVGNTWDSTADFQETFPRSLTFTVTADRGAVGAACARTFNAAGIEFNMPFPANGGRPF